MPVKVATEFVQCVLIIFGACQCRGCSLQIKLHYLSGVRAVLVRDHIPHGPYCTAADSWPAVHYVRLEGFWAPGLTPYNRVVDMGL